MSQETEIGRYDWRFICSSTFYTLALSIIITCRKSVPTVKEIRVGIKGHLLLDTNLFSDLQHNGPSQFLEHKVPNLLTEWLADEDPPRLEGTLLMVARSLVFPIPLGHFVGLIC